MTSTASTILAWESAVQPHNLSILKQTLVKTSRPRMIRKQALNRFCKITKETMTLKQWKSWGITIKQVTRMPLYSLMLRYIYDDLACKNSYSIESKERGDFKFLTDGHLVFGGTEFGLDEFCIDNVEERIGNDSYYFHPVAHICAPDNECSEGFLKWQCIVNFKLVPGKESQCQHDPSNPNPITLFQHCSWSPVSSLPFSVGTFGWHSVTNSLAAWWCHSAWCSLYFTLSLERSNCQVPNTLRMNLSFVKLKDYGSSLATCPPSFGWTPWASSSGGFLGKSKLPMLPSTRMSRLDFGTSSTNGNWTITCHCHCHQCPIHWFHFQVCSVRLGCSADCHGRHSVNATLAKRVDQGSGSLHSRIGGGTMLLGQQSTKIVLLPHHNNPGPGFQCCPVLSVSLEHALWSLVRPWWRSGVETSKQETNESRHQDVFCHGHNLDYGICVLDSGNHRGQSQSPQDCLCLWSHQLSPGKEWLHFHRKTFGLIVVAILGCHSVLCHLLWFWPDKEAQGADRAVFPAAKKSGTGTAIWADNVNQVLVNVKLQAKLEKGEISHVSSKHPIANDWGSDQESKQWPRSK